MRHAVFVALLALVTSSLSLTAEARWHHHHHHHHHHRHYRHVRHHGHHRHSFYYLHARHIVHHRRYHAYHAVRHLSRIHAPRRPLSRQARHWQGPAYASSSRQPLPRQGAALLPKAPSVAAMPAAPAANGPAKAVASTTPAKRVPDWKYPPATIKPAPGGRQHVLAPDSGSFVIIPGYKIVK